MGGWEFGTVLLKHRFLILPEKLTHLCPTNLRTRRGASTSNTLMLWLTLLPPAAPPPSATAASVLVGCMLRAQAGPPRAISDCVQRLMGSQGSVVLGLFEGPES